MNETQRKSVCGAKLIRVKVLLATGRPNNIRLSRKFVLWTIISHDLAVASVILLETNYKFQSHRQEFQHQNGMNAHQFRPKNGGRTLVVQNLISIYENGSQASHENERKMTWKTVGRRLLKIGGIVLHSETIFFGVKRVTENLLNWLLKW